MRKMFEFLGDGRRERARIGQGARYSLMFHQRVAVVIEEFGDNNPIAIAIVHVSIVIVIVVGSYWRGSCAAG